MYTDIDRVAALERRVAQLEAHFTPSQQQPPAFALIVAINRNDELVDGVVAFGGAVDTGIGHYECEWSRPTHWVKDSPWEDEISRLSALAHPQRGEILRRLLGLPPPLPSSCREISSLPRVRPTTTWARYKPRVG